MILHVTRHEHVTLQMTCLMPVTTHKGPLSKMPQHKLFI